MLFECGCQKLHSFWLMIVGLFASTIIFLSSGVSVAQDSAGQVAERGQAIATEQLQYQLAVVEVPTKKAQAIVEQWKLTSSTTDIIKDHDAFGPLNAVVPASFTTQVETYQTRKSDPLDDEQIDELVGLGKVITLPKIVGQNGAEISMRVGRDVGCLVSYQPTKDDKGNDTENLEPVFATIPEGVTLKLIGTLDDQQENVDLKIAYNYAILERIEDFTLDTIAGPLTVEQPVFESRGTLETCRAPLNHTIALCCGPGIRESAAKRSVPGLGRLPFVGNVLTYKSKSKKSTTTIILIRCHKP